MAWGTISTSPAKLAPRPHHQPHIRPCKGVLTDDQEHTSYRCRLILSHIPARSFAVDSVKVPCPCLSAAPSNVFRPASSLEPSSDGPTVGAGIADASSLPGSYLCVDSPSARWDSLSLRQLFLLYLSAFLSSSSLSPSSFVYASSASTI